MKWKLCCIGFIVSILTIASDAPVFACNALIVGKRVSADGSLLFGHVEQNKGDRILNFRVIPRRNHNKNEMVTLRQGGRLPQVETTWRFLWSQNPGCVFSDAYINEWGVAIASNACKTREDSYNELVKRGDIVDGGIDYMLRRLLAERAKTSREAVTMAGELIEQFGYSASGRTLVIADPNEAWLLSMVRGKHWVAQRVPDDAVVLLPNVHIIAEIDLEDSDNFLGSPDVIDYAMARGWYNADDDSPFSFRAAYNVPEKDSFDLRQWRAQCLVVGRTLPKTDKQQLPFSIKTDRRLAVRDVIRILRDHGDEDGKGSLCQSNTQEAAVFQLRSGMPKEIGCVYWKTSAEPCTSVLLPWYLGIAKTPDTYFKTISIREQLTLDYQFRSPSDTFQRDDRLDWWLYKDLEDQVNQNYSTNIQSVRKQWDQLENRIFSSQKEFEKLLLVLFKTDKNKALTLLSNTCENWARKTSTMAKTLKREIDNEGPK